MLPLLLFGTMGALEIENACCHTGQNMKANEDKRTKTTAQLQPLSSFHLPKITAKSQARTHLAANSSSSTVQHSQICELKLIKVEPHIRIGTKSQGVEPINLPFFTVIQHLIQASKQFSTNREFSSQLLSCTCRIRQSPTPFHCVHKHEIVY